MPERRHKTIADSKVISAGIYIGPKRQGRTLSVRTVTDLYGENMRKVFFRVLTTEGSEKNIFLKMCVVKLYRPKKKKRKR